MIVFVDNEHVSGYAQPWGEKIMAARVRIKYELEDLSGHECLIVRWDRVTPDLLTQVDAKAMFISGNSASADQYGQLEQAGLRDALASKEWPAFGFCGGHQVMGEVYGAPLEPIGELDPRDEAFGEAADFAPGMKVELGYMPVELTGSHRMLDGIGDAPVFRHAHSWELKAVPEGFTNYASTSVSPVQLIVHDELPLVGAQFHPEYATKENPAGRTLIENFMKWADLI
ncbi:MAG: glutamine amidotransferase-related protein [Acidimicrobiia bacterium]